jgi:hypothetical protein
VAEFIIPRGPDGEVLPHDHPSLMGAHQIIRRIDPDHQLVDDKNRGCRRLSTAVFKHGSATGHLSIDSEACILGRGREPADYVTSPRWRASVILSADAFRAVQENDPDFIKKSATPAGPPPRWQIGMVPQDDNPCHSGVWGKITEGQSKALLKASEWLVELPNTEKSPW